VALREDERRRETGGRQTFVAVDECLGGHLAAPVLPGNDPAEHAGSSQLLELPGRPVSAEVDLVGGIGQFLQQSFELRTGVRSKCREDICGRHAGRYWMVARNSLISPAA